MIIDYRRSKQRFKRAARIVLSFAEAWIRFHEYNGEYSGTLDHDVYQGDTTKNFRHQDK